MNQFIVTFCEGISFLASTIKAYEHLRLLEEGDESLYFLLLTLLMVPRFPFLTQLLLSKALFIYADEN